MGQNRNKYKTKSLAQQAYEAALKKWKDAEPKTTYGFLSSSSDKAALKQSTKYKNWLASKPKLEDFQKKDSSTSDDVSSSETVQTTDQKSNNKVVDAGQQKDFVVRPQLKRSVMKGKLPKHMIYSSRRVLTDDDANKAPKIRFSGSGKRSIMRGKIR